MGKSAPSPPPAPNPVTTASAQAQANIGTAAAQTALNNVNYNTPYGNSFFGQSGSTSVTNPDGSVSTLPTYTEQINLSGPQQHILDQNTALSENVNDIAQRALTRIGGTLSHPITSGQLTPLSMSAGAAPSLATGYAQGGPIQSGVPVQRADTTFGQTGQGIQGQIGATAAPIQYSVDTAGIQQARDQATNAALARLQPQMDQGDANLRAQLANQGVGLGSSAYGSAMFNQAQQNNDLRLGAVQVGDAEQQALYGQALQSGQFNNAAQAQDFDQQSQRGQFANAAQAQDFGQQQARGQFQQQGAAANNAADLAAGTFANNAQGQANAENAAAAAFGNAALNQGYQNQIAGATFGNQAAAQQLQQLLGLQNQQINEISALRSGGQVTGFNAPSYSPGTLDQTPISADTYQSAGLQMQGYQTQAQLQAQNQAAMGSALGGIFGGIGRKSDRRLKSEVARVATARNGLPIYRYRLAGEPGWHLGMMADEVALLRPDAVWTDPGDGWARVDYGKAVA